MKNVHALLPKFTQSNLVNPASPKTLLSPCNLIQWFGVSCYRHFIIYVIVFKISLRHIVNNVTIGSNNIHATRIDWLKADLNTIL